MSNFLEKSRPLAERGFRCFPVAAGKKIPMKLAEGNHFDHATTDVEQLTLWNRDAADANVGIIPDEHHCYL
jgi:hypothetical protein